MSLLKSNKRKINEEGQKFQEKWELNYFCIYIKNKILCMICNDTISVAKEYNIKRHYDTNHKELYSCFEGKLR